MRIPAFDGRVARLATLAMIVVMALTLAACTEQANSNPTGDDAAPNLIGQTSNGFGFPHEVVTSEGIQSASLYLPIFLVAVVIFLLIEGLLLYMTWRFRRRGKEGDLPEQVHGHNRLEIIWTAIPAFIVTIMFIGSTIVLTDVQATSDDPAAVVDVQAFRFGWRFDYMDPASYDPAADTYRPLGIQIAGGGREGAPEMVVPVGNPVRFRLTAADVIHSFYVPSFFFKRDAIPGRLNEFEVTVEEPGVYGGQCAEFCGMAHSDMFFSVRAVEPADYEAWVAERIAGAGPAQPEGEAPAAGPGAEGAAGPSDAG